MIDEDNLPTEVKPQGIIRKKALTNNQKKKCMDKHNKLVKEEIEAKLKASKVKIVIVKKKEKR